MGTTAVGQHLVSLPEGEFLSRARIEDLLPSFADASPKDWRFSYTSWIYFWDRQIERSGKTTFLRFERVCSSDPRGCRSTFANVYGTDLLSAVGQFQTEVRSGRVIAPERAWF
jgi:hypothetical protein